MDEQKLNEAAEKYAGMSEDKFANSAKKYDAYDIAEAFSSGSDWHEQQNPWRKQNDHPDNDNINVYRSKTVIAKSNQYDEPIMAIYDYDSRLWRSYPRGNPIFTITEWKYID